MHYLTKLLIVLLILSAPLFAYLNESTHFLYNNMLDTRSGGMGGSYIALSDTLIGAYFNPAGLAYIEQDRITESSNLFQSSEIEYKNSSTNFVYSQKSTSSIPPFVGFFQNFDTVNLAFSIITPKSKTINKDINRSLQSLTYYENFDAKNTHILVGPSLATLVGENVALGASLFYSYQNRDYIQNLYSYITANPDAYQSWSNTYNDETIHELLGIVGIQWMPTETLSVGAKANLPYNLSGSGKEQVTTSTLDHIGVINGSPSYSSTISKGTYDLKAMGYRSNYAQFGLGAVYFMSQNTLVSLDINYMLDYPDSSSFPVKDIVNYAIGLEHYLEPFIPVRLGFYTNNSFLADSADGEHIDAMGISGSIGYELGSNKLNIGFDFQWGSGHYMSNGVKELDIDYSGISFMISGSTSI